MIAAVLAVIVCAAAAVLAFFLDFRARSRTPDRDSGDYWASVLKAICFCAGIPVFVSALVQSVPYLWNRGLHLYWDRLNNTLPVFIAALAVPFAVWAIAGFWQLRSVTARPAGAGTWIAGSVGFAESRYWVLLFLIPMAIPLIFFGPERFRSGQDSYPAALWGTLAVVAISIAGVAFSAGTEQGLTQAELERESRQVANTLPDWAVEMRKVGIQLKDLTTWRPAGNRSRPGHSELAAQLEVMGAHGVAPEIADAIHALVAPTSSLAGQPKYALIFAADDAGQIESVAVAGASLAWSANLSTLIVTPGNPAELAARLAEWIPPSATPGRDAIRVLTIDSRTEPSGAPALWLVDAATLSDFLMPRFSEPAVAARIGMVVWWDVHEYTGVLAANVWAISRRLHRLLSARGRSDLRSLALVREASHPTAQLPMFVRQLLPYPFPKETETHVAVAPARPIRLFSIEGYTGYFEHGSPEIPQAISHSSLISTLASIRTKWPTAKPRDAEIPADEKQQFLGFRDGGVSNVGELLISHPVASGASIQRVAEEDLLSLREILGQAGRSAAGIAAHHLGLLSSDNPYAGYLISEISNGRPLDASRRLVGAQGHERIMRRHLLLALGEMEDTYSGLTKTMAGEERIVNGTLDWLSSQNQLARSPIRYLNHDGQLADEFLFKSRHERSDRLYPLNVIGDDIVEVQAATEDAAITMQVDKSRLAIQAYEGRVFLSRGIRYCIGNWDSGSPDSVKCERSSHHQATWRMRTPEISRKLERDGDERLIPTKSRCLLKRIPVKVRYKEYFTGILRRVYERRSGGYHDEPEHSTPRLTAFDTTALLLHWSEAPPLGTILGLCQALRHVIPVHLGVEEDAVEVVPINGYRIDHQMAFGLAIVDLYAPGIGLVNTIHGDPEWIRRLFESTRDWLSDLVGSGGAALIDSPLARAVGDPEDPTAALEFLRELFGNGREQ